MHRDFNIAVTAPPSDLLAMSASPQEKAIAERYMTVFHDRHLPLPPDFALALAKMETSRAPATVAPLGRAWDNAAAALGEPQSLGRQAVWAEFIPEFALHGLGPVLQESVRRCGTLPLSGRVPARRAAAWDQVAAPLEREVDRLLTDPSQMGLPFWSSFGVRLSGILAEEKRGRASRMSGAVRLPFRPNAATCGLVFQVEPDFGEDGSRPKPPELVNRRAQRNRAALRPREGGVEGIITSRRIEDIPNALMSNFMMPSELRMIRLLEEGFTLTHRPPLRTPTRDLMIAGINDMPPGHEVGEVVKAAWLDAALRLRFFLLQMGKANSDLVWCDAALARASAMTVAGLKDRARIDPFKLTGKSRTSMVTTSMAFPGFFAALPQAMKTDAAPDSAPNLLDISCAAISEAIRDPRQRRRRDGTSADRGDVGVEDYQKRILFRVTSGMENDSSLVPIWLNEREVYLDSLGLAPDQPTTLVGLYLPHRLVPGGASIRIFSYLMDDVNKPDEYRLDPELDDQDALALLIGSLSLAFIAATLEALNV